MSRLVSAEQAIPLLQQGEVIAYPTEAVYGLGCDPFNASAVQQILRLKQRRVEQGLILIIAHWEQLELLAVPLSAVQQQQLAATWPGQCTWLLPKSQSLPNWISGEHDSVAIRMVAHPIARALCSTMPLVSTSANRSKEPPARSLEAIKAQFPSGIAAYVEGALGGAEQPSPIFDLQTGRQLR